MSPYQLFWNWAFDSKKDSPIPEPDVLLKYNSPINCTFLLRSLVNNGKVTLYLNEFVNNIGVRYINQRELLLFFKKCMQDFKVKRTEIHYTHRKPRVILAEKLRAKFPLLKLNDIDLLSILIHSSDEQDAIYSALGIDKIKKEKLKKRKNKKKIKLTTFLKENFGSIKVTVKESGL
jgi:hypothetical protein